MRHNEKPRDAIDLAATRLVMGGMEIEMAQSGFQTVENGSPHWRSGATLNRFRTTATEEPYP